MAILILMRHAQSFANAADIAEGGDGDSPLTAFGISQARKAAASLLVAHRKIDVVYSSPLARALGTASVVARQRGLPVIQHNGLKEGCLGKWNGRKIGELDWLALSRDPDFNAHDGESPWELALRSAKTLKYIREQHRSKVVVIVGHGAAIKHGLAYILKSRPVTGDQYRIMNAETLVLDWREAPRLMVAPMYEKDV